MIQSAVVFAYHNVGVRCLSALLANDKIEVRLVVTHQDNPEETIWFESVAALAEKHGIPVITPEDPNCASVIDQVQTLAPDWLFSFYYRHMLGAALLETPTKGAFNMHGSLLPHYRGRVPINWSVVHGEQQSGASLHRMEIKPDAGNLIDQQAVAILPNDTAHDVFQKVTAAAEQVMLRSLPQLLSGSQQETPLDLAAGSYYGGRKPEDGRINWTQSASQIHNLIRAVAPPYPPAFFDIDGSRVHLLGSYFKNDTARSSQEARLYWHNNHCYADCLDGKRFLITALTIDGQQASQSLFEQKFGNSLILFSNPTG